MPQRKLSQRDIESWGVEDVIHWFTSVKLGDTECVKWIRYRNVTGKALLQLTNAEVKNLSFNQNNEKRRKLMKSALSKLPGNSIATTKQEQIKKGKKLPGKSKAGKAPKASRGLRKSKSPSPSQGPTPGHTSGAIFGGPVPDEFLDDDEGLYDRPDEAIKAHLQKTQGYSDSSPQAPPPVTSPPFNSNPNDGYPNDGPEEIYEEGYDDEDEFDGDSFSSGSFDMSDYEEPFEEEEELVQSPPSVRIAELSRPRAPSQANISLLKKKFEIMGLSDDQGGGVEFTAGPKSTSSAGSHIRPSVETDDMFEEDEDDIYDLPPQSEDLLPEDDEDDIYDKVPDEMLEVAKARQVSGALPTHTEAPPPPGTPPPEDEVEEIYGEFDEEDDGEGMYDIPEEALQDYKMASGQDQEPVSPPEDGIMEDIYDTALEQDEPPTSPPITQPPRPPKPGGTSSPFAPSSPYLPPKPGQSPHLPQKASQSPQLHRKADQSPQLHRKADQSPQLHRKANQSAQLNHKPSQSPQWSPQKMPQFNKPQLRPPIVSHVPQPQEEEAPPPRPPKPSEPSPAPSPSETRRAKSPIFIRPELSRPPIKSSTLPPPHPSSSTKPSLPEQAKALTFKPSPHSSPGVTSKFNHSAGDTGHTPPPPPPVPPLPTDMDEEETMRFPKPSEVKGSNLKSLANFSSSPSRSKKAMPTYEASKSGESPKFGAKATPSPSAKATPSPSATQNGFPHRTTGTKTSSGVTGVDRPKSKPPLPSKNTSKIQNLMNRFEKNKQLQAGIASETSNGITNASPVKPDLPPPQKPAADRSPQTGRKMVRKTSFDDLKNKYNKPKDEGQAQPLERSRRVPSPETQPSLPPKPGAGSGVGPGRMQWQRKQIEPLVEQLNLPSRVTEPPDEPTPPPEPPRPPKGGQVGNSTRASPWQRKKIEPVGGPPSIPTRMTEPPDEPTPPPEPPRPPKDSQVGNSPRASPWQRKKIAPVGGPPSIPTRMTEPPDEPTPPPEPPRLPKDAQVGNSPRASPWQRKKTEPMGGPPSIPTRVKEEPPPPPQPPRPAKPEVPASKEEESIVSPSSQQSAKPFVYKPFSSKKDLQPPPFQPHPESQSQSQYPPEDPPKLPEKPRPGFKSPEASQETPKLPERLPPSSRPNIPTDTFSEPPKLPSRPPPQRRPSIPSPNESLDQPHLPSRPSRQQVPDQPPEIAPPPLPSRPKPSNKPLPAVSEDPPLPARPPKPVASNTGSPMGQIWYHSNLDRKKAEAKLRSNARNGTFIVRDSTRVSGEYSLSLFYDGSIRHLRIRLRADRKFVLGEAKEDELAFDTVTDLVGYHKGEPLVLKSGGETTLKYECPQ